MSARSNDSRDSRRYREWLGRAEMDISAAQILRANGGANDMIAFHCQQAIEKALKAYMLFKTGRHIDGHNLTYLCRQAAAQDEAFREYLDESAALNNYYITTRYPSDRHTVVGDGEMNRIFTMASGMYKVILERIGD